MKIKITTMPVYYDLNKSVDFISHRIAPNSAIYLLGSILRENGFNIEIIDPFFLQNITNRATFEDNLISRLEGADVICLSANTLNWECTLYAIGVMRKKIGDSVKIILGGIHPTYFYESIISKVNIDYILRGEGEVTLGELMHAIEKNAGYEKIEGLVSKEYGITNNSRIKPVINEEIYKKLPIPAYDLMPDQVYHTMLIETSRGCRFNCAFCSVPHRNNWRAFDKDIVLERGKKIIRNYSDKFIGNQVLISDDCLTADFKRAQYIIDRLERENDKIGYVIETRATDWLAKEIDESIEPFLSRQMHRILFGIECGYNEGLKRISKGLSIEMLEKVIELLDKKGILLKSYFSFIIGFPWEDIDKCIQTIDYAASLVKRSNGLGVVNLNWLQWYPSRLWENRNKFGIELNDSIFGQIDYNDVFFQELHPNLSRSDVAYINSYILEYENKGIYLRNA